MSASPAFRPILRSVGTRLDGPLPRRTRLLRELAVDLDAMSERLVSEGVPVEQARMRAAEILVPGEPALAALEHIHAPRYKSVTRALGPERLRRVERVALALSTVGLVAVETSALLRLDLLADPSPFLWPVLALGALVLVALVAKAFDLWVKQDHRAPQRGLATIAALTVTLLVTGAGGALLDTYALLGALEASPERAGPLLTTWLARDASLLAATILLVLVAALGWFVLRHWVMLARGDHLDLLGLRDRPSRRRTLA